MARLRNFAGRKIVYEVLELCSFECVQNKCNNSKTKNWVLELCSFECVQNVPIKFRDEPEVLELCSFECVQNESITG